MKENRLQKLLATAIACTAMLLVTSDLAVAQTEDVAATSHNLSVLSGGTDPTGGNLVDYDEICVYCHTPHAGSNDAPLWNRAFSLASFDMYTSATLDMTQDAVPTGVSKACLGCHDGTIGLDVITNAPNSFGGTIPGTTPGTNTMPAGSNALLDTDLRNDHPISIVYDPVADPAFDTKANVLAAGVRLYTDPSSAGDKVQCASCHNPHGTSNEPLLRVSNQASGLCLTCHLK